jgi:hypothetical protein
MVLSVFRLIEKRPMMAVIDGVIHRLMFGVHPLADEIDPQQQLNKGLC